jgi:hypothetical protein
MHWHSKANIGHIAICVMYIWIPYPYPCDISNELFNMGIAIWMLHMDPSKCNILVLQYGSFNLTLILRPTYYILQYICHMLINFIKLSMSHTY